MSTLTTAITSLATTLLQWSPTATLHSLLLYTGIQTHVRSTIDPSLKPLHNICEYLNALHIYADEARTGHITHPIESFHFCSHVRKDLRQCLIYDSCSPGARLLGVEYMIPRASFVKLPDEEKRLWHSHEFEVKSGMLILPVPGSHRGKEKVWEGLETEAMREVVGWYGKTFHLWSVEVDGDVPMGLPRLMGSLTGEEQLDVDGVLTGRNERFGVDHRAKAGIRESIVVPGVVEGADSWWGEARERMVGVYANRGRI